jgi:Cu/Ag efflux pump CusA
MTRPSASLRAGATRRRRPSGRWPAAPEPGAADRPRRLLHALGREFAPTLDEGDLLVQASRVPSISLEESQAMQFRGREGALGQPEVAVVFTRTGTAEIASDPMPPSASDTFVILKPRKDWPDPSLSKAQLVERMEGHLSKLIWATPTSSPSRSRCASTN